MIPHGDIFDAITPINILLIGGGESWSLMEILVGVITPINILFEGRMLIPHQDKVDVTTPVNILFIGNGEF